MTSPDGTEDVPFSPSVLYGILADTRERYVLYYLLENDGRGTINDLADKLAAWENGTTVELLTHEMQNRVSGSLYHADLPKLDDYGFIDFDPDTRKVTATEQLEEITPNLRYARSREPDEYERFLELLGEEESGGARR